ncbi:MAG: hypothetical protein ABFD16_10205 [Thermoguttaceae bacterium]|jgi:hypothetical protein
MSNLLLLGTVLSLLVAVAALVREVRLRRALERLLARLISHLRKPPRHRGNASDDQGG